MAGFAQDSSGQVADENDLFRCEFIARSCARRGESLSPSDARAYFEAFVGDWFWPRDPRVVVRRFRYVFDPVCLACCALYALNRWGIKPHTHLAFFRFWFNDLLLIPCALPPLLQVYRWLKLRAHDNPPGLAEILIPVVLWGWIFEVYLPTNELGRGWCTPDPADIAFYVMGAIAATLFWNRCSTAISFRN